MKWILFIFLNFYILSFPLLGQTQDKDDLSEWDLTSFSNEVFEECPSVDNNSYTVEVKKIMAVLHQKYYQTPESLGEIQQLQKIKLNLETIKNLVKHEGGKLNLNNLGIWEIQDANMFLFQSLVRTVYGGASISDQKSFRDPLLALFIKADELMLQGLVPKLLLQEAFKGIVSLRSSYNHHKEKRRYLESLISELQNFIPTLRDVMIIPEGPLKSFYQQFYENLRFPFSQGDFLTKGECGFCQALSFEWSRRKLQGETPFVSLENFPTLINRLKLMQMQLDRQASSVHDQDQTLSATMNEVLETLNPTSGVQVKELSRSQSQFSSSTKGSFIFSHFLKQIKTKSLSAPHLIYLQDDKISDFTTEEGTVNVRDGHMLALEYNFSSGELAFFDPNLGEFYFENPKEFLNFLDNVYDLFYNGSFSMGKIFVVQE